MYNSGFNDGEALGTNNIGQPRHVTNRQRNEHNRKQPNLQDSPPPSYNDVIEADNINSAYNRDVSSVTESEHTETVAGGVSAEHSSSHTSVNKRATSPEDVIPLGRKLALAVGAAPLSLPIVSATVFITLFLLDVCLLKPRYSSVVLLVGRSFDAISDPIVGFLVNKTQRKGNTLKYWMASALPILVCSYFFLWFVPVSNGENQSLMVMYYLIIYILLQIAFTVYSVPYAALIMYQTNDQKERDIATAFRMTAEIFFAIMSIAVMGGIISDTLDSSGMCEDESGQVESDWLKKAERKYLIAAGVISATVIVSGIVTFFGTNERCDITIEASKISTLKATKRVLSHKPYVFLMSSYFCVYLSVSIVQGNLQLYFKNCLDQVDHFTYAMVALMVCTGLGVPLWQAVLLRWGKKTTAYIGVLMCLPCYAFIGAAPEDIPLPIVYAICCVAGVGIGSSYLIPWSMLPDVIDNYTVANHERNESIFFGFFVFFNKFAAGAGLGISMAFLELAGYENEACEQSKSVETTLRMLCSPGPGVLVLIYCFFIWMYPITDETCRNNKRILHERHLREIEMKKYQKYVDRSFQFENEAIEPL